MMYMDEIDYSKIVKIIIFNYFIYCLKILVLNCGKRGHMNYRSRHNRLIYDVCSIDRSVDTKITYFH